MAIHPVVVKIFHTNVNFIAALEKRCVCVCLSVCVCFQKMFFFLLPVVALLLSGESAVSGNSNDKRLSAVAQFNKDRSWNRFRDVSCTERHNI